MKKNPVLSLALVFISLPAFAGLGKGPGPVHLFENASAVFSISEPYVPGIMPGETIAMRPSICTMIMGGVLGNILGSLGGIFLGAGMLQDEHDILPLLICWSAGSALGSAAGVGLAGTTRNWRGSFGSAVLGGTLGAGLSWLLVSSLTFQGNAGMLSLVPLLILPPIGAAVFFNSSVRPRRLPVSQALLNISAGRLGLGVPDVKVRLISVPGCVSKPEMQFNVNVLSVEL